MALDDNALVTLDEAKTRLGISLVDTSQDANIEDLINAISQDFEDYCSRIFRSLTITDYEPKSYNRQNIVLPQRPITEISKVEFNGTELEARTAQGEYSNYYISNSKAGILSREIGWTMTAFVNNSLEFTPNQDRSVLNVKITYTGGYETIPSNLKNACLTEIAREYEFQNEGYRTVANEKLQSVAQSFSKSDIDSSTGWTTRTIRTLLNYKNLVIL